MARIENEINVEKIAQLNRDKADFIADQEAILAEQLKVVENNAAAEKRIQNGLSVASKDFYKKKEES